MFERFTDESRRVVVLAQEEARLLGHNSIGTEHLLLGIVAAGAGEVDGGRGAAALRELGVELDDLRKRVDELGSAGDAPPPKQIPFTAGAKQALMAAFEECPRQEGQLITTAHLLLGLFCQPDRMACRLLDERGVNRAAVERALAGVESLEEGS